MSATVFIDGESGTTGLQIRERLDRHPDVQVISLAREDRRSIEARREMLNTADVAILCLPDAAAREAASLSGGKTRLIDASTAHRVHADWQYGLPELSQDQPSIIAGANRVANPGCYPTGFILLTKPLVDAGLLSADQPVSVNAVSGYSGGGKTLIASFEDAGAESPIESSIYTYALELEHKHVPEMTVHTGLANPPLFTPSVGRFHQGMLVQVPLALWALPGNPTADQIRRCLEERYAESQFVQVASHAETIDAKRLDPEGNNGTNELKIHVASNESRGQAVLYAVLDNLGKGASGAAVQNLNLMLGLPEERGLTVAPSKAA